MNLEKKYFGIPLKWIVLVVGALLVVTFPFYFTGSILAYDACGARGYYILNHEVYQRSTINGLRGQPTGWQFREYEWKNCVPYQQNFYQCELYKNGVHICPNYWHSGHSLNDPKYDFSICPEADNLILRPDTQSYTHVKIYYDLPGTPSVYVSDLEDYYIVNSDASFTVTVLNDLTSSPEIYQGNITYRLCTATFIGKHCKEYAHAVDLGESINEFVFSIPTETTEDATIEDLRVDFGFDKQYTHGYGSDIYSCIDRCDVQTDCGTLGTCTLPQGSGCDYKSPLVPQWIMVGNSIYASQDYDFDIVPAPVQCYSDADCESPCPGKIAWCGSDNICHYGGECFHTVGIGLWNQINNAFESLWFYVLGVLGWQ